MHLITTASIGILLLVCRAYAETVINPGKTLDGDLCKSITIADDVIDYRRTDKSAKWHNWDFWQAHIAPALRQMHSMTGTGRGGSASGNLHFVLVRHPNDVRALKAIIDYSFIIKKHPDHVPLFNRPECYLQAASIYTPDDPAPYMLFGYYLMKLKQYKLAIEKYKKALLLNPRAVEPLYNIGLAYYRLGQLEEAKTYASKAYSHDFPLQWLRNALARAGYPIDH